MFSAAAVLLTAFCLLTPNLSSIHLGHNSDSLITVLMSLDHWRPFYWGQGRLGMLAPLLASPVRDLFWNTILQTQFNLCALFGSLWLLAGLAGARQSRLSLLGQTTWAFLLVLLVFKNNQKVHNVLMLPGQPYVLSLFLTLAAVTVLQRLRSLRPLPVLAACALVFAAIFVNDGMALFFFLLLPLMWVPEGAKRLRLERCLIAAAAAIGSILLIRLWAPLYGQRLPIGIGTLSYLPDAFYSMWDQTWQFVLTKPAFWTLAAAFLAAVGPRLRRDRLLQIVVATLLASAAANALIIAGLRWVEDNLYDVRYWTTSILLVTLVLAAGVAACLQGWMTRRTPLPVAALAGPLALTVAVLALYGWPSPGRARAALAKTSGEHWPGFERLNCTHLVGNAWVIWPAFAYQKGFAKDHPVFPITHRAEVFVPDWTAIPPADRRYCALCGDPDVASLRQQMPLPPLRLGQRNGEVCRLE